MKTCTQLFKKSLSVVYRFASPHAAGLYLRNYKILCDTRDPSFHRALIAFQFVRFYRDPYKLPKTIKKKIITE